MDSTPPDLQPRIRVHPDWLNTEREHWNRERQDRLRNYPTWSGRTELLRSVPDVGPVVAAVRVAELPEPGRP